MISHKHKFIFVHIPKTAGTSISSVLAPYCDDIWELYLEDRGYIVKGPEECIDLYNDKLGTVKHSRLQEYYDALGDKVWDYYKFTCVRNTYDRLISQSAFSSKKVGLPELKNNYKIRTLQTDFIKINGKVAMDFYIRFENMQEDFDKVCKHLGIPQTKLPHKNKSWVRFCYKKCFDKELKKLVDDRFHEEISLFNFEL